MQNYTCFAFHFCSAANWLKPPDLDQNKHQTPRYLTRAYWQNNSRKLLFLFGYGVLNLLLFVVAMLRHSDGGVWLMVARGCGQCLNFNCTFVVVRLHDASPKAADMNCCRALVSDLRKAMLFLCR